MPEMRQNFYVILSYHAASEEISGVKLNIFNRRLVRRHVFLFRHRFNVQNADAVRKSRKIRRFLARNRRRAKNRRFKRIVDGEQPARVFLARLVRFFYQFFFFPQNKFRKMPFFTRLS